MTTHAIKPRLSEHAVTQMVQRANRRAEMRLQLVAALVSGCDAHVDDDQPDFWVRSADLIIDALEKRHAEERRGE